MPSSAVLDDLRVGILSPGAWANFGPDEAKPVGGVSLTMPGRPPVYLILSAGPDVAAATPEPTAWDPIDLLRQVADMVRPGWVAIARPAGRWVTGPAQALRVLDLRRSTSTGAPRPGAWQVLLATAGPLQREGAWSEIVEMTTAFGSVLEAATVEDHPAT